MYPSPNRYTELHLAGMQSLIEVAHAQLAALERVSALNLSVARSTFYGSLAAIGIMPDQRGQAGVAVVTPSMADADAGYSGSVRKNSKGGKGNANLRPSTRGKDRKAA